MRNDLWRSLHFILAWWCIRNDDDPCIERFQLDLDFRMPLLRRVAVTEEVGGPLTADGRGVASLSSWRSLVPRRIKSRTFVSGWTVSLPETTASG